eukprot:GHUV01032845.1.p1 GENE.GHUV01032845.1~~GHUV01032845.1.p1  ORF type:complete len:117 (-),score=12.12 GHUV01032845.1:757-1107(-)
MRAAHSPQLYQVPSQLNVLKVVHVCPGDLTVQVLLISALNVTAGLASAAGVSGPQQGEHTYVANSSAIGSYPGPFLLLSSSSILGPPLSGYASLLLALQTTSRSPVLPGQDMQLLP